MRQFYKNIKVFGHFNRTFIFICIVKIIKTITEQKYIL